MDYQCTGKKSLVIIITLNFTKAHYIRISPHRKIIVLSSTFRAVLNKFIAVPQKNILNNGDCCTPESTLPPRGVRFALPGR